VEPHHDRPEGKKSLYSSTRESSPPGGQTRSSLAGGSQPIALPCRSKAAATDQEAGHYPRVLHPRSDDTRCYPADSSWACPPSSWRIDVYSHKVPARPEAQSALQGRTWAVRTCLLCFLSDTRRADFKSYSDSSCPQFLHPLPDHPVDILSHPGKISHHIQV